MLKSFLPIVGLVAVAALFGLTACASFSPGGVVLSPRNAYITEIGLRGVADLTAGAARSGRLSGGVKARLASSIRDVQAGLPVLRSAYDSGDYLGAALELASLALPASQAHALATGQTPQSTASDIAAGLALFTTLAGDYAQARAVLSGDPANLPAAIVAARGQTDASLAAALAALSS